MRLATLAALWAALRRRFGARGFSMDRLEEVLARLEATSYDSAAAQAKVAEAAGRVTRGMENVPSWYRTEMQRFDAATGISATTWAKAVWRGQRYPN